MQRASSRWRNLFSINSYMFQQQSSYAFHSTPCSYDKWKSKWNSDVRSTGHHPSKTHIKYVTRQKRADAKKALKNLLYNSGSSKISFEDKETKWNSDWYGDQDHDSKRFSNKDQPSSGQRFGGKSQKKTKRKIRRESFCEDFDDGPEQIFQARFGSSSDRTILGLPATGPLKIEDVKNAFRLSALKWHPDKHQGPSQAMAEEKFKLCVNAYKSLCNALSTA
ncbi:uncharacterized protein LOC107618551 isoform X4 [Arachis ipaensis]|uniref:uncharacterized protein LOC107618551 isoform X4 n=1 Tax=Arachis ipaensis TaxID=130454 RepID=UPI000A2B13BF|nr:uncharacterized protein LOC107618551 isoform X4 [Arachis ipaensis]XP_025679424.1 uncharacterized protein LOC112779398 isoform X4 [Arachis hypogaea]